MNKKLLLLNCLLPAFTMAQNSQVTEKAKLTLHDVMEVVTNDSLKIYYNQRYSLIQPDCADIVRYTRIDTSNAAFKGEFIDYYTNGTVALEGRYTNSLEDGLFTFYYPNGQIHQKGIYKQGLKTGLWQYFYPDGKSWQTLDFINTEVLINEFWNEGGIKKVSNGLGEYSRYENNDKFTRIYGNVVNGHQEGIWKREVVKRGMVINKEKFETGKFIKGTSYALNSMSEKYTDLLFCTVEDSHHFLRAKKYLFSNCSDIVEKANWQFATYPGGPDAFYRYIQTHFKPSYEASTSKVKGKIQVQVTINEQGEMTNFKPVSTIGFGLEEELIRILRTMSRWHPTKVNGKPVVQPKIISYTIAIR